MYGAGSRLICAAGALALLVGAAAVPATPAERMRERRVRTLLSETRALYRLYYKGSEVGTEKMVRRLYDDNTIVYEGDVDVQMSADVHTAEKGTLVLEEESHFPRSYRVDRVMESGGKSLETHIDVQMFANVARRIQTIGDATEKRNVVLPTGTPLIGTNVVYPVYQLLFWYDRERGGRQSFEVFEVSHRETERVVLSLEGQDSVAFDGGDVETDVYLMDLPTHPVRYYVDRSGRIIAADLGFLRAELVEWAEGKDGEG